MSAASIIAIINALLALAPQIPELIAGVQTAVGLLESGNAPTPEEQASIDAALDAAHAKANAAGV
jgi:hypothetical protein